VGTAGCKREGDHCESNGDNSLKDDDRVVAQSRSRELHGGAFCHVNTLVTLMFIQRASQELERDFRETFQRLVSAGTAFDAGQGYEAAGIAAAVYVLVHEGGKRSPSLLTLLGRKAGLKFIDSARSINPRNLLTEIPLVMMQMSSNDFAYIAKKDHGPPENLLEASFSGWWEKAVLRDPKRREFSRKNLIHFFRHFRGGGHVGRQHEPQGSVPAQAFADMALGDPGAWLIHRGAETLVPEYGADYASVRQIGWEVEQTIRRNCVDLIPSNSGDGSSRIV
jgi:hypothetical protein